MSSRETILLLVDLQEGLVETARTQSPAGVRRGARALVRVAKALDWPLFLSCIPLGPGGGPPLLKEIVDEVPTVLPNWRRSFGAFADVRETGRVTSGRPLLLVAGVLTEAAVLSTSLEALRSGWDVRVVLDATAGMSERTEAAALRQIEAEGGMASSIASLATEFVDDLSQPTGQAVLASLRGLLDG